MHHNRPQFQQRRSHHEYRPHERAEGEPDGMETVQLLPQIPREKLMKLFDDGTLRTGELDHRSVLTLKNLSEPLQLKVVEHLVTERLFLTNSRSKSGFLVSACEKAKRGELDARGFGALDPWRATMKAECITRPVIHLIPETEWLSQAPERDIHIRVMYNCHEIRIQVPIDIPVIKLKELIYSSMGSSADFPMTRFRLAHPMYGSLRNERSLAYYNMGEGTQLQLKLKLRGGRKVNRDF
jgi:hypothetical protein